MKNIFSLLFLLVLILSAPTYSTAYSYKIVAIVNGESISNIQLKDRVNLIISSSGISNTPETKLKVTKEAMEVLINETLQNQEAKAKGVEVTEVDIQNAMSDLEKRNQIAPGTFKTFIAAKGLSYEATMDQVKAGIQWKKTVSRFFRSQVMITDAEVNAKKKELSKLMAKSSASISEIIIPESFEDKAPTTELIKKIITDTRAGADFAATAKKYSVGRTASKGGFVGWVDEGKIIDPLASAVRKTKTGGISDPIHTEGLYVIVRVNDRKVFDPINDEKSIREAVMMEKLDGQSKRYIKELRQKALIERKYTDIKELI